ncbi:hypothetical protein [Halostagnicola larsenii]|uniref:hypothetical protein n=1 Tax=Halostagnicola larsenii TaxID=353800 RepID=UPI0012F9C84B|nr:hypothetical protein [Halostagnicola larsenii]
MTETNRQTDRKHPESPWLARRLRLAAPLAPVGRCGAYVVSLADRASPFQSYPRGGLAGSIARGKDDFSTREDL